MTAGEPPFVTAIASPNGENATPKPFDTGKVAGLANLVPNPDPDQGYTVTNGVVVCAIATASPAGLKAMLFGVPLCGPPAGKVAGLANLVPKPEALVQA